MKAICFILLAVISISVSYAKQLDLKASHFKEAKPLDSLNLESLNLNTKGNKSVGLKEKETQEMIQKKRLELHPRMYTVLN